MKSSRNITSILLWAVMVLMALNAPKTMAQEGHRIWTSTASTGVVDESDVDKISFHGPFATFKPAVQTPTQAVIRYNVVAVDGLFAQGGVLTWPSLVVNYRDNGANARVLVYLREYEFGANPRVPPLTTRVVFDSDLFPQSNDYQTRAVGNCGEFNKFEFVPDNLNARAYYLEANLIRNGSGVDSGSGLGALALSRYGVCLQNGRWLTGN